MLPHQKYSSAYKSYGQYPESAVPQSPFDVAYGSSLLPRQLLVSSPFVQVASPLPSPGHHAFHYQRGPPPGPPAYMVAPPPPKLSLPPESRKRGIKHQQLLQQQQQQQQQHQQSRSPQMKHGDDIDTPLKAKYKSISSSTSSLDESTFDIQINHSGRNISSGTSAEDSIPAHIYANMANRSSSSSLYQLHSSQSHVSLNAGSNQLSKLPTRSIMLMGVDPELTLTRFLDFITFGPLESARISENYPEEGVNTLCLTFLKMETCLNFYNNLLTYLARFKKLINSPMLSITFVHCKKLLPFISYAVNNDGATRNVYIGNLDSLGKLVTQDFLRTEFSKFGIIDKIDLVKKPRSTSEKPETNDSNDETTINGDDEKSSSEEQAEIFAFIHFTSIASAIKAVEQLSLNTFWQPCKIFYGTDRCSMQNSAVVNSLTDETLSDDEEDSMPNRFFNSGFIREEENEGVDTVHYFYPQPFPHSEEDIAAALNQKSAAVMAVASTAGGAQNIGNRTICLANLDPKTKVEDICNVVRGGILQAAKYIQGKKVCFLTFIDAAAAAQFFANANINPIVLHGRRVKVGWGKHSGPLPTAIALAVTVGASRNVYIGIKEEDLDTPSAILPDEETLRADFSTFGEIEQVNYFKQNRCVFLNFHNITAAMKVVEDANGANGDDFHESLGGRYKNFKISFGKDRCGNPPKAKKKKKNKKRKNQQQNRDADDDTNDFDHEIEPQTAAVEEVPAELFASMGITSKADDDNDNDDDEEETHEDSTKNVFGITTTANRDSTEADGSSKGMNGNGKYEIPDYLSISSSETSEGEMIFTKPQASFKGSHDSSQSSTSRSKNYQAKQHRHKNSQSYSSAGSRPGSRVSSHASLNSLYYAREPETLYYKSVPFAPPMIQGRSGYNAPPPGAYRPQHFSTNGSQVMAQYLAESQHANMVYAANVLNTADADYFEDEYGNGYRRTNRVGRR
ncbi:CYFA0S01e11628g1_1 [Cyberlindnera fabianii]|uniref:CYFA0S01e11628g1_1 n=1 Tax=Cyberlindnera fabianii TaxID=36022 RepID=A0A061AK79_CYBFA|nr:CYFA0S01e11628g1_1 [Cyberlindnera fabianii]